MTLSYHHTEVKPDVYKTGRVIAVFVLVRLVELWGPS